MFAFHHSPKPQERKYLRAYMYIHQSLFLTFVLNHFLYTSSSFSTAAAAAWTTIIPFAKESVHTKNNYNHHFMTTADTHESYWCPKQQIFLNGSVPNLNDEACRAYLDASKDLSNSSTNLRIFGYGSLCWRPDGLLCDANRIKRSYATALGYKRCWCQKSADHRGTADFCGIVCTLLSDDEVASVYGTDSKSVSSTYVTEGVVYEVVPKDGEDHASFIDQLLEELDFREKGGYARDLIDVVVLDEVTNEPRVCQALLYRGTHESKCEYCKVSD